MLWCPLNGFVLPADRNAGSVALVKILQERNSQGFFKFSKNSLARSLALVGCPFRVGAGIMRIFMTAPEVMGYSSRGPARPILTTFFESYHRSLDILCRRRNRRPDSGNLEWRNYASQVKIVSSK